MLYNKIKEIAKYRGISINEIEQALGFSRGSICKWDNNSPSWKRVQLVANYLNCDVSELFTEV